MSIPEDLPIPAPADELEPVVEKISTEHGFDVRGYKRTTLYRRIRKRMTDARCATVEDYLVRLETDGQEYAQLINTILINVTEFFRDPHSWDYFQTECLNPLLRHKPLGEPLRAWCVGCATGEEAYSLAICLSELTEGTPIPLKIYATDMDEGALAVARAGIYDADDLRNVTAERREKHFEELPGGRFRIRRELRAPVIFGHHNALEDAPISRLDVLICRNLLIYFDTETQQLLLKRFHYGLRDQGYLFLGKAETLMSRSPFFRTVEPRHRIFQRVSPASFDGAVAGIHRQRASTGTPEVPYPTVLDYSLTIEQLLAPVLILDAGSTLLAASPHAREIFGVTERTIGRPLVQLDERVRPASLRVAVEDARTTGREARVDELHLVRPDGCPVILNVDVRPVVDPHGQVSRLVLWGHDVTREHDVASELSQVRQELETTGEELQTTNEELETTNEELQSTNEELETTNEELQSTNEELETTIEELQSTNEELVTANDELRARQEDLNERERFQAAVLSSLQTGLIVIRPNWEVVSWNRVCEELWGLREEEVVGVSLLSLDSGMPFDRLEEPVSAVLRRGVPAEPVELSAVNRRGKTIRCRVRIHPLQVPADGTGGAMIMIDTPATTS